MTFHCWWAPYLRSDTTLQLFRCCSQGHQWEGAWAQSLTHLSPDSRDSGLTLHTVHCRSENPVKYRSLGTIHILLTNGHVFAVRLQEYGILHPFTSKSAGLPRSVLRSQKTLRETMKWINIYSSHSNQFNTWRIEHENRQLVKSLMFSWWFGHGIRDSPSQETCSELSGSSFFPCCASGREELLCSFCSLCYQKHPSFLVPYTVQGTIFPGCFTCPLDTPVSTSSWAQMRLPSVLFLQDFFPRETDNTLSLSNI